MTSDRDIEPILDHWFMERPIEVADRVLDEVADRVGRQTQQPAWLVLWRDSHVNTYLRYSAAVAAGILVTVIGYNLLAGSSPGIGGLGASPSPTGSAVASSTVQATAPSTTAATLVAGPLAAGTYTTTPFPSAPGISLTFDVPGGWEGFPTTGLVSPKGTGGPDGLAIAFLTATSLFRDPCQWDVTGAGSWPQPGDVAVGESVDDLVDALSANGSYVTTDPVDVTIGGYSGRMITIKVPDTVDLASCDRLVAADVNAYFAWSAYPADTGVWAQGPGQRWELNIVDVDGERVMVVVGAFDGTSATDRAAAQAIIDSIVFRR